MMSGNAQRAKALVADLVSEPNPSAAAAPDADATPGYRTKPETFNAVAPI